MAGTRQSTRAAEYHAGYEPNIRLHLVPRIGKKLLVKLSVRDVRLMITAMRKDGMKTRAIQYAHATLRTALNTPAEKSYSPATSPSLFASNNPPKTTKPRPTPSKRPKRSSEP